MAIPTYNDIANDFRAHMGDTEVTGGQLWTNASGLVDPYIQQAYSELYKGFEGAAVENIQRTLYGIVPAFTTYIDPASFGAANFSEPVPKPLWERDAGQTYAVSGAVVMGTPSAPFVRLTTAPHTLQSGQVVLVFGVGGLSDDVNDIYGISVPDTTHVDLMGSTATGTYTSGGSISYSTSDWSEVLSMDKIDNYPPASGALSRYAWVGSRFRTYPANVGRQIRMTFYLSANAPTGTTPSASMGFDDCRGFLAYRAAALAHKDKGRNDQANILNVEALGPTGIHQDWGGLYGLLMRSKARSAARNPTVVGPYRNSRRNAGFAYRY